MPLELSDSEIISLTLEDSDNFALIIDRYENKLFRYVMRLGDFSIEECEDLLQDIFIKVYTNLNEYDVSFTFSSWIYRIAHNTTIDYFRKKNVRAIISLDDKEYTGLYEALRSDEDISFEIMQKDMQEAVKGAIGELPRELAEILIFRYIEEKSYEEISDILKIPISTVGTLIHRAKKKLEGELLSLSYHI